MLGKSTVTSLPSDFDSILPKILQIVPSELSVFPAQGIGVLKYLGLKCHLAL